MPSRGSPASSGASSGQLPGQLAALPCLFHTGVQVISLAQSPHTAFEVAQRLVSMTAVHLAWLPAVTHRRWHSQHQTLLFVIVRLVRGYTPGTR